MVMMEEFRRRRNLKRYFELMKKQKQSETDARGERSPIVGMDDETVTKESAYK